MTVERPVLEVQKMDQDQYMEFLDSGEWTLFEDAFAEATTKFHEYESIIVQGNLEKALPLFKAITKVDPYKITCQCCEQHFSIRDYDSVFQATGNYRNCNYDKELNCYVEAQGIYGIFIPLEEFLKKENTLIIFEDGTTDKPIKVSKKEGSQ